MPPRVSRAGLALDIAEAMREFSEQLSSSIPPASSRVESFYAEQLRALAKLSEACLAVRSMYANYPRLRRAVLDAGARVEDFIELLRSEHPRLVVASASDPNGQLPEDIRTLSARTLALVSMNLRTLRFTPADSDPASRRGMG